MTDTTAPGGAGTFEPTFSLVVPVHDVEGFLPSFLDSLDGQSHGLDDCEIVFVDDGSTDSSAAVIEAWIARTSHRALLVRQENRGLSGARNAGLQQASGTWVTFPDPDDVLDAEYVHHIREFVRSASDAPDLVCARLLILDDETGRISDTHPLRAKFHGGTRVESLDTAPDIVHLSAASGFYRRERVEALGLRFDDAIRPNFEDGAFTTLYLAASEVPRVGIVADAHYLYRRRSDASSVVQRSWALEGKYTTVVERGYLWLLQQIAEQRGAVPRWAQNVVLYDLLFYFRVDERTHSGTAPAPLAWTDRFHELAEKVLAYIDAETIDAFSVMPTSDQLRSALVVGYKHARTVPRAIRHDTSDAEQGLVRIRYFCGAQLPEESIRIDGRPVQPAHAKTRDVVYLNRTLVYERILWLPAAARIDVSLGGTPIPLLEPAGPRSTDATSRASLVRRARGSIRERFPRIVRAVRRLKRAVTGRRAPAATASPPAGPFAAFDPVQAAQIGRMARSRDVRRRFADAWAFIDRDTEAHDNAEHLYRYVRRLHPDVNAWFVLRQESGDWDRLASEGFRLAAFGSADHALLLLSATHVISSQVDDYVTRPMDRSRFGAPRWRLTFLQHGVIHTDLSRWLNPKPIDRFITSSADEHAGIVGDHTPYVFTEKEVRLTGMPRHDRLHELRAASSGRRAYILVVPTWRGWLMTRAASGNERVLKQPLGFTEFWRSWNDLLVSPELKAVADGAGLEVAFVPHPNLQPHISTDDLPSWVGLHRYGESDVQDLMARAAVTVTDYSSQAFDAAYVECPVVYYQFDADAFFTGTHVGRRGAWDYVSDGFGPVTATRDHAVAAIRDAVARLEPDEPYRSRMRTAFPFRDGRCCERTVDSILALNRPWGARGAGPREEET